MARCIADIAYCLVCCCDACPTLEANYEPCSTACTHSFRRMPNKLADFVRSRLGSSTCGAESDSSLRSLPPCWTAILIMPPGWRSIVRPVSVVECRGAECSFSGDSRVRNFRAFHIETQLRGESALIQCESELIQCCERIAGERLARENSTGYR